MLTVTIPDVEYFNESTLEFTNIKSQVLQLEHSLVSVSKWEAVWGRAFLSKEPKTYEQTYDYIRCMTLTQNVNPMIYKYIPDDIIDEVTKYIEAPMTATTFQEQPNARSSREVITSELIYFWMVSLNIPFECQKWHLNRLLAFIRVCNLKNTPPKKMNKKDILSRNRQLNAERRNALNTKG
jgi:hypothetical protein